MAEERFDGSAAGGAAAVVIWPNAADEISIWVEEAYRKEGQGATRAIEAMCSLPKPVALALGERLIALAGAGRAEVARLAAAIARHLERAARDDHEAMRLGREDATHEWADLPEAQREAYRDAVAADFWREP